jgi:hypothetical protein
MLKQSHQPARRARPGSNHREIREVRRKAQGDRRDQGEKHREIGEFREKTKYKTKRARDQKENELPDLLISQYLFSLVSLVSLISL